jgi:signal peptidase II
MKPMVRRKFALESFLLALLVFSLDQTSKYFVITYLREPLPLIKNFFYLQQVTNGGAAWNLMEGHRRILLCLGVLLLIFLFLLRKRFHFHEPPYHWFFGAIVGGACGNLWDRLRFGYVIDFIDLHLPFYRWPAFNLADSAICIGLLFYFIHEFFSDKKKKSVTGVKKK